MSPQRASCTSITSIRSLLIVTWTMQQRRRYSPNRQPQFRRRLLNHRIPRLGGVAMLISLAIIDSRKLLFPFLFREALFFNSPPHAARRSVLLTPRLEWQDERRSFCFPPPVGAGIHSRGVKGARPGAHQRTFSLSTRRTFSLSSDILRWRAERGSTRSTVRLHRLLHLSSLDAKMGSVPDRFAISQNNHLRGFVPDASHIRQLSRDVSSALNFHEIHLIAKLLHLFEYRCTDATRIAVLKNNNWFTFRILHQFVQCLLVFDFQKLITHDGPPA